MKERLGNMLTNKRTVQASTKFKVTIISVALFLLTLPLLTVASSENDSSVNTVEATQAQVASQSILANPSYESIMSLNTTVPGQAYLDLGQTMQSSSGAGAALVNERITYSITVRNLGEFAATDIVLTNALPTGLNFVDGSVNINGTPAGAAASFSSGTLSVDLADIAGFTENFLGVPSFTAVTITFQADVTAAIGTDISNQAQVSFSDETSTSRQATSPTNTFEVRQRSIRGTIWLDANENGFLDAGEERLAGITVNLQTAAGSPALDIAGNPIASTATDSNGVFTFTNMPAGSFRVVASLPAEHRVVPVVVASGNQALRGEDGTTAILTATASAPWTAMPGAPANIGLIPIPPAESALTKVLHTPADQPAPDLNFTFEVRPYAWLSPLGVSNPANLNLLPTIGAQAPPPAAAGVGHRTFNINESNADITITGSTRTMELDIDLLSGIDLRSPDIIPGIYIWHIHEVENSSGVNAIGGLSSVEYSPGVYELRITVVNNYPNQILEITSSVIVADAASSFGAPLYSWGPNTDGLLGRPGTGVLNTYGRAEQVRIPATLGGQTGWSFEDRFNWVTAATAAGASAAINSEGHLYVWGNSRTSDIMGRPTHTAAGGAVDRPERLFMPAPASGQPTEIERINAGGEPHRWVALDTSGGTATARMFAINDQGEVWAWGNNAQGQLGRGVPGTANTTSTRAPVRVATHLPSNWVGVSTVAIGTATAGRHFTLLINEDGHVYSAGNNGNSELGRAGTTAEARSAFRRINASAGNAVFNAPAGVTQWHTMRAGADSVGIAICRCCRSLYSWGLNSASNIESTGITTSGTGAREGGTTATPTPVDVGGITGGANLRWADVIGQIENRTWVALTECGRLFSWRGGTDTSAAGGLGRTGGGGAGSATDNRRPREVGAVHAGSWIGIGGGNRHTFAMTADGILFGWGSGADGRLGRGSTTSYAAPVSVMQTTGLQGFSQTGSGNHSMALVRTDPMTFTNVYNRTIPDPVTARADLTKALRVPADQTASNLTFDFNIERHSFNGDTTRAVELPQLGTSVVGGVGRLTIDMNHSSTTVETTGGASILRRTINILDGIEFDTPGVYVWRISEVEGSSNTSHPSFVVYSEAVYELTVTITLSSIGTLGTIVNLEEIVPDSGAGAGAGAGTPLYAWGTSVGSNAPRRVGNASNWIQVSTATGGSIALNSSGEIYTWGDTWTAPQMGQANHPNPGTGTIHNPTRVGDRDDWTFVSLRGTMATAINDQGHLYTWGVNLSGRLGHGDTLDRNVPTRLEYRTDWVYATGINTGAFALGLTSEGHLYSWGRNDNGQLGLGVFGGADRLTPQRVGTASNWVKVGLTGESGVAAAVNSDGQLFTWGNNSRGQLGQGDTGTANRRNEPTRVGTASNWVDVVGIANAQVFAAINSDGELWTWGGGTQAELGELGRPITSDAPFTLPGRVGTASNWIAIGGGNRHGKLLNSDMQVYAWGSNAGGQLGIGSTGGFQPAPHFVTQSFGFLGFSQSGGGSHSMALMRTESMTFTNTYGVAEPTPFSANLTKALEQVAGQTTSNLSFDFEIRRHSFNGNTGQASQLPQLGSSVVSGHGRETLVMSGPGVTVETVGGVSTLRRTVDLLEDVEFDTAGVYVWRITEVAGSSGATPPSHINYSQAVYELRVEVTHWAGPGSPLRTLASIHRILDDAGNDVSDPTVSGFPMMSWGDNATGRLGRGTTDSTMLPGQVGEAENWMQAVTASGGSFAVNSRGELFGWGVNATQSNMGQGGDTTTLPHASLRTPTRIGTGTNWVQVSARSTHVVALTDTGAVYMWGAPSSGSGVSNFIPTYNVPTRIAPHVEGAYVVTSGHNVYVIDTQGRLFSKGTQAALGSDVSPAGGRSELEQVGTGTNWASLSAGPHQGANVAAAITTAGHLYTWGSGGAALGHGDSVTRTTPTRVGTDSHWAQVTLTSGPVAGIALTDDGRLFSWGSSQNGRLGRVVDTDNPQNRPGQIGEATNWRTVSSANSHVLAFNADGELWGWGMNHLRQLGINGTADRTSPELVLRADDFSAVSYGGGHHSIMLFRTEPAPMVFTNVHTRTTSLEVSKEVVGDRANLTQLFTFDIRLDPSALCSSDTTYTARVYTGTTFSHEVTFSASTTSSVDLLHNQRLVFGAINTGTSFNVYERAVSGFTPSVGIHVAGTHVTTLTAPNPGLSLGTDTRVTGEGRNSANFINTHHFVPVTGIENTNLNLLITVIAALAVIGTALGTRHALQGEGTNITQTLSNLRASNLTLPKLAQVSLPKLNQVSLPKIPSAVTKTAKTTLKRVETLLFRNIGK